MQFGLSFPGSFPCIERGVVPPSLFPFSLKGNRSEVFLLSVDGLIDPALPEIMDRFHSSSSPSSLFQGRTLWECLRLVSFY